MSDFDEDDDEKLIKTNNKYIEIFRNELIKSSLKPDTILGHLSNVDLFLNHYAVYREGVGFAEAIGHINMFFCEFFIRKCMWSSLGSIKKTAASLKKFYKCMYEHNIIDKSDFLQVKQDIKEGVPYWIELFNDYYYGDRDERNFF